MLTFSIMRLQRLQNRLPGIQGEKNPALPVSFSELRQIGHGRIQANRDFWVNLGNGEQTIKAVLKGSLDHPSLVEDAVLNVKGLLKIRSSKEEAYFYLELQEIEQHERAASGVLSSKTIPNVNWQPLIVDTDEKLSDALHLLKQSKCLSCDTETIPDPIGGSASRERQAAQILTIGIPSRGFIVDLRAGLDLKPLQELLSDKNTVKLFYYSTFDLECLSRVNISVRNIRDPRERLQELFPFLMDNSLKSAAELLSGILLIKEADVRQSDWSMRPLSEFQESYAVHDVEATYEVDKYLEALRSEASKTLTEDIPGLMEQYSNTLNTLNKLCTADSQNIIDLCLEREALLAHIRDIFSDGTLSYESKEGYGTAKAGRRPCTVTFRALQNKLKTFGINLDPEQFPLLQAPHQLRSLISPELGPLTYPKLDKGIHSSMEALHAVHNKLLRSIFERDSEIPFYIARLNLTVKKLQELAPFSSAYSGQFGEVIVEPWKEQDPFDRPLPFDYALKILKDLSRREWGDRLPEWEVRKNIFELSQRKPDVHIRINI